MPQGGVVLGYAERMALIARHMEACELCGNRCRANRAGGDQTVCGAGDAAAVAWSGLHHGEEPPISGTRGCGNIFFQHCSLSCVYCQNWQISNEDVVPPATMRPLDLAVVMLRLQEAGAHTVGLVAPTSHLPTIVPALYEAKVKGLRVPVVYNTGGFDTVEALRLVEGLVDIYLPDMKYGSNDSAKIYSGVVGYVEANRAAVLEMVRQAGRLVIGQDGVAQRGVLIRHLVLPAGIGDTVEVLEWIARHLPRDVHVSLMSQYKPSYQVSSGLFPELNRKVSADEYRFYLAAAEQLGLENLFTQELDSSETYNPDFREHSPFRG